MCESIRGGRVGGWTRQGFGKRFEIADAVERRGRGWASGLVFVVGVGGWGI